ncbi:hypothetical protein B7760_04613 [Burkholderia glumae]|uniref:hypothetical protein n=1 Tax=Burkholderia glumae TaxID=337 RepID=UPI0013740B30|nr:hypothetical protein [Burkholderia glumae]MCR1768036.1 hypothetical protein [Burkholderia glumae]QHP92986.1 hypothetical protein EXE55_18640 [Burkholderia glumae]QKM50550.1 hypothetical protein B7760_04613 [Burkholderia glumae]
MPVHRTASPSAPSSSAAPALRARRPVAGVGPTRAVRPASPPAAAAARDGAARVLLPVTLEGTADYLGSQRRALLRSPIGVYVSHIDAHRDRMAVWFDLARADLNFAIHTLLTTLPDAALGCLRKRASY